MKFTVLVVLTFVLACASDLVAQVSIDYIEVRLTKKHIDNVDCGVGIHYSLDVDVKSPDLMPGSQVVTPPPSSELMDFEYSDEDAFWTVERECYFSSAPTGVYTLRLSHAGGSEIITVDFDLAAPTSYAFVTSPVPGSTDVPTWPTFEWDSVSGVATFLHVEIGNKVPYDEDIAEIELPTSATQWLPPAPLFSGVPNGFLAEVFNKTTTSMAHPAVSGAFDFVEKHGQSNEVHFTNCDGFVEDVGEALAGTHGPPRLSVGGSACTLDAGSSVLVFLNQALESSTAFLVVGVAAIDLPFNGGTLIPAFEAPLGLFIVLATDTQGELAIPATWPAGVPLGTEVYLQYWIEDPAAPFDFSASNAVRMS